MSRHALVIGSGPGPLPSPRRWIPTDLVIAVDGGADHAAAHGVDVDVLVGDLDSVSEAVLARLEADPNVTIERHPEDKDQTDLELALERAVEAGVDRVDVLLSTGGRLDHLLASFGVLASPRWADLDVRAATTNAIVHVARASVELNGDVGSTVSILATGGPAEVSTSGLRWPLDRDRLGPGSGRGVSNQLEATTGEVLVTEGVVLVIQPDQD